MVCFPLKRWKYLAKLSLRRLQDDRATNTYLTCLENDIIKELVRISYKTKQRNFQTRKLFIYGNSPRKNLKTLTKIRLIIEISKAPARLRWICFWMFEPTKGTAYAISRNELLRLILVNWKTFSDTVLRKMYISYEVGENAIKVGLEEYLDPKRQPLFEQKEIYHLDNTYHAKQRFSFQSRRIIKRTRLGRIILWDSRIAISLLQQSERLRSSAEVTKFIAQFPSLVQLLSARNRVQFLFHPLSANTLDENFRQGMLFDFVFNAQILHQRFILADGKWIVIDSTCSPHLPFVAGQWQYLETVYRNSNYATIRTLSRGKKLLFEEAIFLMGRADENWFHFIIDTLPRYLNFESLDTQIPVLVRSDLPITTIELLERLFQRKIVYIQPEDEVCVKKLYFVPARSSVFDSKVSKKDSRVKFSPIYIRRTRNWILESISDEGHRVYPEKIFLTRKAIYRNLVNEDAIIKEFGQLGYSKVVCDQDFYRLQYFYFSNVNHLVGPGGAALANLIFMKPGSQLTVIRSWRDSNLRLWHKLSDSCGIYFSELVGIPTYFGTNNLARQHSDFYFPAKLLRIFLNIKKSRI